MKKIINNIQVSILEKMENAGFDKDDCNLVWNFIPECYSEIEEKGENILAKINRAKESVAREILEKIEETRSKNKMDLESADDELRYLENYIRKEHLFESDYTNNK